MPLIAAEGHSDAEWFSHIISDLLYKYAEQFGADIPALMDCVMEETLAAFEKQARHWPESTKEEPLSAAAILYHGGKRIYAASLSDTVVLVETPYGIKGLYGDENHREFDQEEAIKTHLYRKKNGLTLLEARAKMRENTPGSRTIVNKKDGFWVLGLTKEPLVYLKKLEVDVLPGAYALMLSDGLYRLVDTFNRYDDESLLRAARKNGLRVLFDELREIENNDPEADQYPRMKKSDDATAMFLQF